MMIRALPLWEEVGVGSHTSVLTQSAWCHAETHEGGTAALSREALTRTGFLHAHLALLAEGSG